MVKVHVQVEVALRVSLLRWIVLISTTLSSSIGKSPHDDKTRLLTARQMCRLRLRQFLIKQHSSCSHPYPLNLNLKNEGHIFFKALAPRWERIKYCFIGFSFN